MTSDNRHGLTEREFQILQLISEGLTNKEIGSRLGISVQTVKNHVGHILIRAGTKSRAHAVAIAFREGWFGETATIRAPREQTEHGTSREKRPVSPSPGDTLTVSGVASLLNIHANTVRRWGNQGVLRSYSIGPRGDRRFKRSDIDEFLKGGNNGT